MICAHGRISHLFITPTPKRRVSDVIRLVVPTVPSEAPVQTHTVPLAFLQVWQMS